MNQVLNYFLESSVCMILFYGFYELVQKREMSFQYNRFYLLGGFLLSLIIPLINISIQNPDPVLYAVTIDHIIQLPEVTITGESDIKSNWFAFNLASIITIVYLVGVAFFLVKFLISLYKVFTIIWKSDKETFLKFGNATVVPTDKSTPICSFFGYILWNGEIKDDRLENSPIFQHELAHIKHKHSWDLLLLEISAIVLWFNPIVHLLKKAVQEVHEYIVDAEVAKMVDKNKYIKELAHQTLNELNLSIVHPFNKLQIMKRISMLEKSWKRSNWIKMSFIVPLIGAMALIFSCQTENIFDTNPMTELPQGWSLLKEKDATPQFNKIFKELRSKEPVGKFYFVELDVNNTTSVTGNKYWAIRTLGSGTTDKIIGIASMHPDGNSPYKDRRNVEEINLENANVRDEIFTIVEEQPVPEGGLQALYEYVKNNLKYPEQAKKDTVQGKVYVQFVVDKTGAVSDAKVVKGIGAGCDEEALRVIANGPKWVSGKQKGEAVNVRMILPITFSLGIPTPNQQNVITPTPKDGINSYLAQISNSIIYPEQAKKLGVEGKVFVEFVVDKDGSVTEAKVVKGIGAGCDEEAIRVLTSGPKWSRGTKDGEPIAIKMTLPITFALTK